MQIFQSYMAKLKKFITHRRLESRPNTRRSKYRSKAFNRSVPQSKIVKYDLGNLKKQDFKCLVKLCSIEECQIRSNALESMRQICIRRLDKLMTKGDYHFQVRAFPHHIMRENPTATGAGADRLSTGMKCSFGVAIGIAARIHPGQCIAAVYCEPQHVESAKKALFLGKNKLPCTCKLETAA